MKSKRQKQRNAWRWASLLGCLSASTLSAAETNAPAAAPAPPKPLTPEQMFEGGSEALNNWIDFSVGGYIVDGNKPQFQQRRRSTDGAFGGIEDFHYQTDISKGTTLTADGHGIYDNHDYKLSLGVVKENTGYVRLSYDQFRTWYNGDGGYYPFSDSYYRLSDHALELDRGEFSFEAGLAMEKKPKVTFKYTHGWRDGDKGSTSWGLAHPGGGPTKGISPSFRDIDERRDILQADVTHKIKTTDFGVGIRYESTRLDDALKITQAPFEPAQRKITDSEKTGSDLYNAHAYTETWLKKNILLTTGFSFTDLEADYSGSRIYGSDFDVGYAPNAANGLGYYGLGGGSSLQEYVMDLNLLWKPRPTVSLVPSVRVQKEDVDADFDARETLGANGSVPFNGAADRAALDVRERLDFTYTGVTNWVFYARGELTEGEGNVTESGGFVPIGAVTLSPIRRDTDDERWFQKYSAGARWYPLRRLNIDAGGYYKLNSYDYDHRLDNTPNNGASLNRYPAYLVMQDFETYDANIRFTLRPFQNVTLVSRYEYQMSTVDTKPDSVSGLSEVTSSKMISHILAQDVSWAPWSRLYLQAGFNYVISDTKTPTSEFTAGVINAQNNYWTVNCSSGFVVDDKTDLNLGYFYYQANNDNNYSPAGLPLSANADEHGVTAGLVRRISKNLRLSVKYAYFQYNDSTFGGHQDNVAHLIYSSLRYRF